MQRAAQRSSAAPAVVLVLAVALVLVLPLLLPLLLSLLLLTPACRAQDEIKFDVDHSCNVKTGACSELPSADTCVLPLTRIPPLQLRVNS